MDLKAENNVLGNVVLLDLRYLVSITSLGILSVILTVNE